ncbi:hypothetical protein Tco_0030835 [Tanacetum coccineum]
MSTPATAEEKTNKKNDVKARGLLLMALPNEYQLTFSQHPDAKSMFAAIETRFGGNAATKKTQKTLLKQQSDNAAILGVIIAQEDLNLKILSSLPPEWNTHIVKKTVGTSSGGQNLAFMTAPSSSNTNDANIAYPQVSAASPSVNAAKQIHDDDLEAIDLNASTFLQSGVLQLYRVGTLCSGVQSTKKHEANSEIKTTPGRKETMKTHFKEPEIKGYGPDIIVLLKTGLTPLNTVRPVNTAHPKTAVHSAKSRHNFSKQAQSTAKRPFYKQTALTRRYVHAAKRHYYTGRHNVVNTARSYTCEVNAVRVKRVNAVKSSAYWVWRPTKSNGAALAFKRHNYINARGRSNGCSRHMTGNIAYLSNFKEFDGGYVAFRGGAYGGKITGKGTLKTDNLDFEDCIIDETSEILKSFIKEIENLVDKKVKIIRSDNETEFKNKVMDDFCREKELVPVTARYNVSKTSAGTSEENSQDCIVMPIWKDTSYFDSPTKDVDNGEPKTAETKSSLKLNAVGPSVSTASPNEEDIFEEEPEVDLGNITNSYIIPTTPNTRIHKDHPIDNVIGEVQSTIQTRRMSKPTSEQGFLSDVYEQKTHDTLNTCLYACFLSQIEPTSIAKALSDLSWVEAMQEELLQFKLQQVWILVDLPNGKKAIGTKWVFRNKKDERGIVIMNPKKGRSSTIMGQDRSDIIYQEQKGDILLVISMMSSMGELTFFLGLQVQQRKDGIFNISQRMEMADDVDVHLYRSMIGSLMYLNASRPDIMFAVCACARFQVTPKTSHLLAVKRIFGYLKGKPTLALWYFRDSPFELVVYTDSDYAGATQDRKSTTRGCQFLGNRLISWQCKKQTVVATSTTEAEYVAAASCCGQVKHVEYPMLNVSPFEVMFEKKVNGLGSQCSGPRCQDTILGDVNAQTRLKLVLPIFVFAVKRMLMLPVQVSAVEELARMGYEKPSQKLTFYKAFFSPQWKYFIHTITQCLSAKSTAWNEFSSSMASLIICLATNQKFNLSKYIFDAMVKHLDGGVKFLLLIALWSIIVCLPLFVESTMIQLLSQLGVKGLRIASGVNVRIRFLLPCGRFCRVEKEPVEQPRRHDLYGFVDHPQLQQGNPMNEFTLHRLPQPKGNMNGWLIEDEEEVERNEVDSDLESTASSKLQWLHHVDATNNDNNKHEKHLDIAAIMRSNCKNLFLRLYQGTNIVKMLITVMEEIVVVEMEMKGTTNALSRHSNLVIPRSMMGKEVSDGDEFDQCWANVVHTLVSPEYSHIKRGKVVEESGKSGGSWKDNKKEKVGTGFVVTNSPKNESRNLKFPSEQVFSLASLVNGSCNVCYNWSKTRPIYARNCAALPTRQVTPVNAVRMSNNPRVCYECGSPDHFRNTYPKMNQAPGQAGNQLALEGSRNNRNNGNQVRGRAYQR